MSKCDILGSVSDITDSSGQSVTDTSIFDAFGNTIAHSGSTPTPFGFAGRQGYQTDASSGLQLLGNRFYDSSIGRFLSRDPAGEGDNWYAYCDNNPVSESDPTGLEASPFSMSGTPSQAQVEAQTILNGGLPGESYNVKQDDKLLYSFTISGSNTFNTGWGLGAGILTQFLGNVGPKVRNYGASSTQAQNMRMSAGYRGPKGVLEQIVSGLKSGGVNTPRAAMNTFNEFNNGTQAQLGAFSWNFTNPNNSNEGIDIINDVTFNSLVYHIPEFLNADWNVDPEISDVKSKSIFNIPTAWDSGPMSTIHQIIHINFP